MPEKETVSETTQTTPAIARNEKEFLKTSEVEALEEIKKDIVIEQKQENVESEKLEKDIAPETEEKEQQEQLPKTEDTEIGHKDEEKNPKKESPKRKADAETAASAETGEETVDEDESPSKRRKSA